MCESSGTIFNPSLKKTTWMIQQATGTAFYKQRQQ